MKDPAFLFYPSDFLTGCTNLTMEERGQYISLLCIQHQTGHLSEKTIRLSVANVSVDVLSKFQQDENGLYFNARLEIEMDKRSQFVDSRRVNGSKGGRPAKPLGLPSAKPNGKAKKNLPINVNEIEIKDVIEYFYSNGYTESSAKKFFDYYSASNWIDSNGKQVKNWKQKAQGVWFKDENKIPIEQQPTEMTHQQLKKHLWNNHLIQMNEIDYLSFEQLMANYKSGKYPKK